MSAGNVGSRAIWAQTVQNQLPGSLHLKPETTARMEWKSVSNSHLFPSSETSQVEFCILMEIPLFSQQIDPGMTVGLGTT